MPTSGPTIPAKIISTQELTKKNGPAAIIWKKSPIDPTPLRNSVSRAGAGWPAQVRRPQVGVPGSHPARIEPAMAEQAGRQQEHSPERRGDGGDEISLGCRL